MGLTTHAFMLSAIDHAVQVAEEHAKFVAAAVEAREEMLRSGDGHDAADVHAHIQAVANGEKVARPKAISWRS